MKKIFTKLFFAAVAVIGFSVSAQAQTSATVSDASATANIIAPITLTADNTMDLGSIIKGVGTVTLNNDGTRTFTNPAMKPGTQGTGIAGLFTVGGEADFTYGITLGLGSITDGTTTRSLTLTSGVKTSGTLTSGADTFNVGASISLDGSETTGAYTGTYEVTVAYN